ncbi:MAG TPA: hypothetical protein V6C89_18700 [Drouetiella sp.]|jgi:hypothetical protein
MCFFQSPFLLPLALLVFSSPVLAWFLFSRVAKFALRRFWAKWYVRRAVDVSFVGIVVLCWVSFLQGGHGAHYSDGQRIIGDRIRSVSDHLYETHSPYEATAEKLYAKYWDLDILLNCRWFLENFGSYVILPASALFAIGYTIERSIQAKSNASETTA